tara:strand:+ start:380 stop:730 length:351 start_codon:yes stop_codon:yes gene_type:complete
LAPRPLYINIHEKWVDMGITVYTTTPDRETAKKISEGSVENGLAACCNFWPVETIYKWENELKEGTEYIVFLKTTKKKYKELEKWISKEHPYSMAAIVAIPWEDSYEPYRKWVDES